MSDATPDVSFSYDANSNLTKMVDGAGSETYAYDALDRLTTVTRGSDVFSYEYNLVGSITKRTYPDLSTVLYTYDDDERMTSVSANGGTTNYGYDPAANLTSTTLPATNGYVESRAYDRAGRIDEVKHVKGTTSSRSSTTRSIRSGTRPASIRATDLSPTRTISRTS